VTLPLRCQCLVGLDQAGLRLRVSLVCSQAEEGRRLCVMAASKAKVDSKFQSKAKQSRWFWLTLDFIQFQSKAKQRATKSKGISKVPKWGLRERRPRLHPLVGRSPHARTASDRSVARVARHAVRRATRSTRSTHSTRSTRSTRPQHTHSTRSTRSTRNEQHGSGSSGERRRGGGGGGSGSGSGGGEVSD
jgi:uncharacterized membrane protein YgcG